MTTTLRSTPCGRGGAGGTSPLAIRSVQSANILSAARAADAGHERRHLAAALPHLDALSQAAVAERTCPVGNDRVDLLPTWWQRWQPFMMLMYSSWRHDRRNAVALRTGAGELAGLGQLDQREPVVGRINLRRFLRRPRRRGQLQFAACLGIIGFESMRP